MQTLELKSLIRNIEVHKSSGIEGISSSIFKVTIKILFTQFRFLFKLALHTGIFPDAWKQAIITPLHKANSKDDPGNYRPIASIPLAGKLLEKLMHAQVYSYLENNCILANCQYGFRRDQVLKMP